jgi:hypothetical protein
LKKGNKNVEGSEDWSQPDMFWRVGIKLVARDAGPVYFYTKDIHEAKFLYVNIHLNGNPYKKTTMS